MATTYKLIESKILTTTTASVEFTSIPNTYTDIIIFTSARSNVSGSSGIFSTYQFNGSVNPTGTYIFGDASAAYSGTAHKAPLDNAAAATASTFSNAFFYMPNYANTSYNKTYSVDGVVETIGTEAYQLLVTGAVATTSAINAIKITPGGSGSYVQYSSFYLYGISNT
jgi:hypothetical protein